MKTEQQEASSRPSSSPPAVGAVGNSSRCRHFALLTIILVSGFSVPFYHLARFAAGSELYSYILLIPWVSAYLAWLKRKALPPCSRIMFLPAVALGFGGLSVLAGYLLARHAGFNLTEEDYLFCMMSAFFLLFFGGCWLCLGSDLVRALAFPIGFLIFMIPMPTAILVKIETFLQHGSAWVAQGFFELSGATFFRSGLVFHLPGINLEVAPECSGIHSSLVLFITSSVASYFFLRTPWKRALFVLAVIPLALLRNGFRVFVIGELCTHIGPQMIDSPIHHRGGPLFFALSLIPFFLLLFFLRKSERFEKIKK